MANIIYGTMVDKNEPMYGKFIHPIKGVITSESDKWEKDKNILTTLYNVEKSNRYAETIMGESDFESFMAKGEGQEAENDSVERTFANTIEHIEFGKEFTITKKMADDSKFGIASDTLRKPANFIRAYYRTRVEIAAKALINGTSAEMTFNRAKVKLTTGDGLSLFNAAHKYNTAKMGSKTQSNRFYGEFTTDGETFEKALNHVSNKLRNFKDENGNVMGYVADTLIIPGNRPEFEAIAKKVCGSERTVGSGNNDINTQYGNWTIVVLPYWDTATDKFMVMSSDANKSLWGNLFFNRIPLDITSGVDPHTRNLFFNGYCRFGVGFGSWKHIALAENSTTAVSGATQLTLA